MRLALGLFTIIILACSHEAREAIVGSGRQNNEGVKSQLNISTDQVIEGVETYEEDEVKLGKGEDKTSSNLRVPDYFTPLTISQPIIHSNNGNQQIVGFGLTKRPNQQQDYMLQNDFRGLDSLEVAIQEQTQSSLSENIFYLDNQPQSLSALLRSSLKSRVVNMGVGDRDDRKSRQHLIIRVEPDSQQQDNILKSYEALKLNRQNIIQHKRLFLQRNLFDSKQLIRKTNINCQKWLQCLIVALAAVVALPLFIALVKISSIQKSELALINKNDIPKANLSTQ